MKILTLYILLLSIAVPLAVRADTGDNTSPTTQATVDDGSWFVLTEEQLPVQPQHTDHLQRYGEDIEGYNRLVLEAIDKVQASAMDGGGYFTGIKADPPESPIGYGLTLFSKPLLDPPRRTSYCSGATYTAFIEALNLRHQAIGPGPRQDTSADTDTVLDPARAEAMRLQEPDGGRREDGVKFWGHWNDDGFGTQFALVQYSQMGKEIAPNHARPGDFMNISWTNGHGHSVVFLGWYKDTDRGKQLLFWSSQKSTHGMGDKLVPLSRIQEVKIVRLTDPDRLFSFDPTKQVNRKVPGDTIDW